MCSCSSMCVMDKVLFLLIAFLLLFANNKANGDHQRPFHSILNQINLNFSEASTLLEHFWQSTGYCPPLPHASAEKWLLSQQMERSLAYIGAIPHSGIENVRVHWLLDTVKVQRTIDETPFFNFTFLDAFIYILWQNNLKPAFELMGNPGNIFTDFENITQINLWHKFVQQMVSRFVDEYGLAYVSGWNFETWNEPNYHDWDGLNMTLKGFLNYFDASANAINSVSKLLKFGGPGGSCRNYSTTSFCWALLKHISSGRNSLSGKPNSISYISIHKKGEEPDNTATMLAKEADFFTQLQANLPSLSHLPIYNDEGDPLVGWSQDRWWRADVTYAAMIVKIIEKHQNQWITNKINGSGLNFKLLSNDNGFLSYQPYPFTQRTLLARFQVNNTAAPYVQFVRKPSYTVMGLLSKLGDLFIPSSFTGTNLQTVGLIASKHISEKENQQDSNYWSVIIYNSADTHNITGSSRLHLNMIGIHCEDCRYAVFVLDNEHGNPHAIWAEAGKPPTPDVTLFKAMHKAEEPVRFSGPAKVTGAILRSPWNLTVRLPGVVLLQICDKPQAEPDEVTDVRVYNITTGQVFIKWSDSCAHARCIKTFEVEFAAQGSSQFTRINQQDTIFNSFVFIPDTLSEEAVTGSYRVRAVDFWLRPGAYSLPVSYP